MAVSSPATMASDPKLIDPGIKKVFFAEFEKLDSVLDRVFKVGTANTAYDEYTSYAGYDDPELLAEGQTYSGDAPLKAYDTTLTTKKYGRKFPVSYELSKFQYPRVAGNTEKMVTSFRIGAERVAASVFNRATNTSYTSYGDGLPAGSTAHTVTGGGSNQSNASSTSVPLTSANLDDAITSMIETLDDRGQPAEVVPDTLVVPPALLKKALEIVKSDKESGTANNDVNVQTLTEYAGSLLNVVCWKYIGAAFGGSDTRWFLLDSSNHQVTWNWAERPHIWLMEDAADSNTDMHTWKGRMMFQYGWTDWRGIWVSNGTGVAYSS